MKLRRFTAAADCLTVIALVLSGASATDASATDASATGAEADHAEVFASAEVGELEARLGDRRDSVAWDAHGRWGSDRHAAVIEIEGGINGDGYGLVETRLVYAHLLSDFFDLRAGGRFDVNVNRGPNAERGFAVVALTGLAPLQVEVDAEFAVSDHADVSARLSLDRVWIVAPRVAAITSLEVEFELQDVRETSTEAGPSALSLEARLFYDLAKGPPPLRAFQPYVGVSYGRVLGNTADRMRSSGTATKTVVGLVGIAVGF